MVRRLRLLVRDRLARGLVLEHPFWSWLMVVGALNRASSYWIRPPEAISPASARIEGTLSYPVWTVILITYALLIAAGTRWPRRHTPEAWLGHAVGAATSCALASSVYAAAVFDGGAWSSGFPLVVVMLIHAGRANALGPRTRRAIDNGTRWAPGRRSRGRRQA